MAVFAIDAGGTRIKLGLVHQGCVLARTSLEARSDEGLEASLPRIAQALHALCPEPVSGLALAFPSLIHQGRIVGDVGKYQDAETLDLEAWAAKEFGAPLIVENDARMAAIGEWQHGAAKGAGSAVMVTLGTGIGTGVIMEGRVLRGAHGSAGILGGHTTAQIGGITCPCGNRGCWETLASTAALALAGKGDYSQVFNDPTPANQRIKEDSLEAWGALAVSLIHAYDPEILVFGGGVMASGEAILEPIRQTVSQHAWTPWGSPRIVSSHLGDDAALLAAEWILDSAP